ncbi:GNAT family N-acetyltransferase [Sphingopyxis macrogoltabida]|uniref:Acetyltransferase n=1 Tax=Sphingopyxis macrogoltabida TaxID=33050 RepID=A0AAC9AUN6_SPHMC|nr:GNAT family N-acetyltransferase [Sphingopyxis macrogoltabida]ALJ13723.1 acetyltransferase [Sphingopyxis macrogoltabida]AMU88834.1 acetyltransferase [Sphingopyxis macrogoltabida]
MLTHRLATPADLDALRAVMARAIAELQQGFLDPAQIAASRAVMGLDTQLIADGTYFVIEEAGAGGVKIAGCGGWSHRATLYGGDHSKDLRDPAPLDPAVDAARIRAMYTHPDFTRRGVGRMIMTLCEDAARAAGFRRAEMMATLSGEPLYRACGYTPIEHVDTPGADGVAVPMIRMGKDIARG